jgi:hypothetical protein
MEARLLDAAMRTDMHAMSLHLLLPTGMPAGWRRTLVASGPAVDVLCGSTLNASCSPQALVMLVVAQVAAYTVKTFKLDARTRSDPIAARDGLAKVQVAAGINMFCHCVFYDQASGAGVRPRNQL